MVKRNSFADWGILQFVRGWLRRRRFVRSLEKCERLNRASRHRNIVVCFDGEPFIINKRQFKEARRRGVFSLAATWGELCRRQVTRTNLNTFFSPKQIR